MKTIILISVFSLIFSFVFNKKYDKNQTQLSKSNDFDSCRLYYFEDSIIKEKICFYNNQFFSGEEFNSLGQLVYKIQLINDSIYQIQLFNQEKLVRLSFENKEGIEIDSVKEFHLNGKIKLFIIYDTLNEKQDSFSRFKYEGIRGTYLNQILPKNGIWRYYSEEGGLIKEEYWKNGILEKY